MVIKSSTVLLVAMVVILVVYTQAQRRPRANCTRLSLENGRVRLRGRGRVAKFKCRRIFTMVEGDLFATCVQNQWNGRIPKCIKNGCVLVSAPENGQREYLYRRAMVTFTCSPGYALAGSTALSCNSRTWNASVPSCVVPDESPQLSCDFEGTSTCGWVNSNMDDFDWEVKRGPSQQMMFGTGPIADHTLGTDAGHYIYIESSIPRPDGHRALLFSPVYTPPLRMACFTFYYHMYGVGEGGLKLYVKPEGESVNYMMPVMQKGFSNAAHWLYDRHEIHGITTKFQIVLEAVQDAGSSDVAIDDVLLAYDEACLATTTITSTTTTTTTRPTSTTLPTTNTTIISISTSAPINITANVTLMPAVTSNNTSDVTAVPTQSTSHLSETPSTTIEIDKTQEYSTPTQRFLEATTSISPTNQSAVVSNTTTPSIDASTETSSQIPQNTPTLTPNITASGSTQEEAIPPSMVTPTLPSSPNTQDILTSTPISILILTDITLRQIITRLTQNPINTMTDESTSDIPGPTERPTEASSVADGSKLSTTPDSDDDLRKTTGNAGYSGVTSETDIIKETTDPADSWTLIALNTTIPQASINVSSTAHPSTEKSQPRESGGPSTITIIVITVVVVTSIIFVSIMCYVYRSHSQDKLAEDSDTRYLANDEVQMMDSLSHTYGEGWSRNQSA